MTYTPKKPDVGPSPFVDAPTIQTNFSQFASIFSQTIAGVKYNHTPMNDSNQGDHESVIFELQSQDPGVTEDLVNLYSKNATSKASIEPQLWMQIPKFLPTANDTTQNPNLGMQLTYNSVGTAGPIYYSFLAGEQLYLIYFGTDSGNTTPNVIISDTITVTPTPTQLVLAIATPNTITSGSLPFTVSTQITASNKFVITSLANGSGVSIPYSFQWVAIAKA